MPNSSLMFLHALTSLHPGAGTALGTVDLPVQRERHTGWPVIPGSSLKGVLRDACREVVAQESLKAKQKNEPYEWKEWTEALKKADKDSQVVCAFGGAVGEVDSNSPMGALSICDARILLFPVRSLCGLFAWVTCPAALKRFARDLEIGGIKGKFKLPQLNLPNETSAIVPQDSCVLMNGNRVVLEEYDFTATKAPDLTPVTSFLSECIGGLDNLPGRLVVLRDDFFTYFVRNATEVSARIALEYSTKTVREGALFYQEMLPPETVFYSLVHVGIPRGLADDAKTGPACADALTVIKFLRTNTANNGKPLQIGGDSTTGKGLCAVHFYPSNGGN
jgi:CRISPR-associated protein Cmr4